MWVLCTCVCLCNSGKSCFEKESCNLKIKVILKWLLTWDVKLGEVLKVPSEAQCWERARVRKARGEETAMILLVAWWLSYISMLFPSLSMRSAGEKFSKSCRRSLLRMMSVVRSLGELFHCIIRGEEDSFSSTDTSRSRSNYSGRIKTRVSCSNLYSR